MTHVQRVTFLCTSAPWHPGPRARILPLASYAAACGVAVTMLCLSPSGERKYAICAGVHIHHVAQMHVAPDGRPMTGFKLWWTAVWATIALIVATLHSRPTVIVIAKAQPMNGIAGLIAGRLRGVLVVLDSDDDETESHGSAQGLVRVLMAWWEARLPRWVRSTVCATHWQAKRISACGCDRVAVIPNGVYTWHCARPSVTAVEAFQQRHHLPPAYLVYIGNLSTRAHAVDVLLQAYARSNRLYPLVLAGSGHDAADLAQLADTLGISGSLIWIAPIAASEIPLLLAGALASVDPVRDTVAAAARCPLKIIESIAQGVPVITSPIGDRFDILGSAGFYAHAGDTDAYAAAIEMAQRRRSDDTTPRSTAETPLWDTLAPRWYAAQQIVLNEAVDA